MKTLSQLLTELVPQKGKSAAQVAKRLNIAPQRLSQYMNGERNPKADFFVSWKKVFGEDLQHLLYGVETKEDGEIFAGQELVSRGDVYRDLIEKETNYILHHKSMFEEYRMVPKEILQMLHNNSNEKATIEEKYKQVVSELKAEIAELESKLAAKSRTK